MARKLADIPFSLASEAQQAALMRLQLYTIGETHQLLRDLASRVRGELLEAAGDAQGAGLLDGLGLNLALRAIESAWSETFADWKRLFEALRREAAAIPFGTLAVMHRTYFAEGQEGGGAEERRRSPVEVYATTGGRGAEGHFLEQGGVGAGMVSGAWFYQQLQVLLDAADQRVYGDGFRISERIWNLDQQSLEGIRQVIYNAVASGNSAWNMAQEVADYLGAGAECPRWTRTRLYGLTKQDIASGDRTGLYSGDECAGQGVSYNALRLLRNEIQTIHHAGADMVMNQMPWAEKEEIHLSPSHPDIGCECEDVVIGGEDGTGIYPKGTITLPIHVQCLCYKTAVLMDADEFTQRVRGWMTGGEPWRAMDDYADWLGVLAGQRIVAEAVDSLAGALVDWLWGGQSTLDKRIEDAAP